MSKTDEPQQWGCPSKAGSEKYKKGKYIMDLFPNKKPKLEIENLTPITLDYLINEGNILNIPCSFSNIIKHETFTEVDRACKTCLDEIIENIEFECTSNSNKKYIAKIFFNQSQNSIPNFTGFPLNYK